MKKLVCILAMGALVLGFTSCHKECNCTVTLKDGQSSSYAYGKISHTECGAKNKELEQHYAAIGADLKQIDCNM